MYYFDQNKNFPHSKGYINKMKRQPTKWEKTLANHISDKGLTSKIYKECVQLKSRKKKKLKNGQRI